MHVIRLKARKRDQGPVSREASKLHLGLCSIIVYCQFSHLLCKYEENTHTSCHTYIQCERARTAERSVYIYIYAEQCLLDFFKCSPKKWGAGTEYILLTRTNSHAKLAAKQTFERCAVALQVLTSLASRATLTRSTFGRLTQTGVRRLFRLALILCLLGLPRLYGATILCRCLVFSVTMLMKGRTTTALRIAGSAEGIVQRRTDRQ